MAKKTYWHQSVGKFEKPPLVNEDAAKSDPEKGLIAISDGAGGGGVYADLWSQHLVDRLPATPISTFKELDDWMDEIWEPFYNSCEQLAQKEGGILLDKFYNEGAFATLVAVWRTSDHDCKWFSYGDSVAFCYNPTHRELFHSFSKLADFNKPPYLLNCKDEINETGFRAGEFHVGKGTIVFCASDALAHYILASYEMSRKDCFADELADAIQCRTRNSVCIEAIHAMNKKSNFDSKVIKKLILNASRNRHNFKLHLSKLRQMNMLTHDDYSISVMRI